LLSQPEKAKEAYAGALQIDPNDYQTLNNMAYLLAEKLNDPKSAKQYSEKAYQLVQRFGGPLATIQDTHGWVLTLCGGADAKQGLSLLQRLVSDNNDFLEGRYHYAKALLKAGKPAEAADQLQQLTDQIADRDRDKRRVSDEMKANVKKALDEAHQNQGGGLKF
jgi:tetratricopeptide (TPR) repeat protein